MCVNGYCIKCAGVLLGFLKVACRVQFPIPFIEIVHLISSYLFFVVRFSGIFLTADTKIRAIIVAAGENPAFSFYRYLHNFCKYYILHYKENTNENNKRKKEVEEAEELLRAKAAISSLKEIYRSK